MRILAFVDIHADYDALQKLIAKAKKHKPDLLINAGDLSMFGRDLDLLLHELDTLDIPLLTIAGNHEDSQNMKKICETLKNCKFIDKSAYTVNDYIFLGYGGGGFAQRDSRFSKIAKIFKKKIDSKKPILVTHAPPYGTSVDKINGSFAGNRDYTKFIKEVQPCLVIAGHLHENKGKKAKIGKTTIINPGWEGTIVDI